MTRFDVVVVVVAFVVDVAVVVTPIVVAVV